MIKQLASWTGSVSVNGTEYATIADVPTTLLNSDTVICLVPLNKREKAKSEAVGDDTEHVITVRQWMTRYGDNPMPMRTMVGRIKRKTAKAFYVELHGQALPVVTCMRCGKALTNPISRHYGLGIECIQKVGIPFSPEDVENIKEALVDVLWSGWIPYSAVENDKIFDAEK